MANILDRLTLGTQRVLVVDADPSAGGGTPAPVSSLAMFDDSGVGELWIKEGAADTAWTQISAEPDVGEANTASNEGTGGVGVFKQKTGVNLEFKNINAGSNKVSITDDTGDDEIDVDVVEANLTLDNLGGTLGVSKGGTGLDASAVTDGQLLIGNDTNNDFDLATLTAGSGISITNGAGSITIAATGFSETQNTVSTTDATITTLATIATTTDSEMLVKAKVLGRRTGGTAGTAGDGATYERTFRVKNVGDTVTIHDVQSDFTSEDQAGWAVTVDASGTNARIRVTGATDNNIDWKSLHSTSVLS